MNTEEYFAMLRKMAAHASRHDKRQQQSNGRNKPVDEDSDQDLPEPDQPQNGYR